MFIDGGKSLWYQTLLFVMEYDLVGIELSSLCLLWSLY